MEELNINELIKIEQMPRVFEQLETIGKWVDEGLAKLDLKNLAINEENKKEIKAQRTEINNVTKLLEEKRKEIKSKILEPYGLFEKKYNEEVKNKLTYASDVLGEAIDKIEVEQKSKKENELRQFFDNYNENYHLEQIVSFEDVGLNITLSASETSLKKQIVDFLEKVSNDFMAIQSCENREEVLLEYKHNSFNYSQAVNTVNAMKEEMARLESQLQQKEQIEVIEQQVVENVRTLVSAPQEIIPEEQMTATFTVTTSLTKLKKLKQFLKEEGIEYK